MEIPFEHIMRYPGLKKFNYFNKAKNKRIKKNVNELHPSVCTCSCNIENELQLN